MGEDGQTAAGTGDTVETGETAGLGRRGFLAASGALLAATRAVPAGARAPGPMPDQRDWTVHAGCALLADPDSAATALARDVHLLIRYGRIEAIRERPFREALPHLDCSQELLVPGFISGHTHCCSATPTRGIIEGGRSYARPLELVEALSDDEMDALTALNLAELIRSGCTTQVEMSLSHRQAESYARVATRLGARGYPGAMIPAIDRLFPIWFRRDEAVLADSEAGTLAEIQRSLDYGRRFMNANDGLLRPMMSPHACDTHTEATLQAIGAAARELGTGMHIHLSQGDRETATVRRLHGKTPTQWLDSLGLLEAGPVFGAHMSGLDWSVDPEILRRREVVYAHCPSAGGAGGVTQPYPEALAAGLAVNVAIDTHSNDYLENLKLAVLYGQARHALTQSLDGARATTAPTIRGAVDAATLVPARGLGRDDLGIIAAGAQADLVSIDVSGLLVGSGALPPEPLNNLLYANGCMVRCVMTAGRVQVRDGAFIADDTQRLLAEGGAVARTLWARLEDEGWFTVAQ